MAAHTHSDVRITRHRRLARKSVSVRSWLREEPGAEVRGRPTDVQVWNWAGSAVLFGYGPAASDFI